MGGVDEWGQYVIRRRISSSSSSDDHYSLPQNAKKESQLMATFKLKAVEVYRED